MWQDRRSDPQKPAAPHFSNTGNDSPYQRDRARIIHSASFRSLQSKTQVLGLGESDFYRTRLTHSLEVAQIGSGLCESLRQKYASQTEIVEKIPSFTLIEAICLAHDIGHCPFGHGGEVAMNAMMYQHGGFEANAQTLRILARLGEYSPHHGLDLTRRTMLGTLKYPALYSAAQRYHIEENNNPLNIDHLAPPKCIYDDEADVLSWLLEPFSAVDRDTFMTLDAGCSGHAHTLYKVFDTSIMELADDIAYGVHDLEDALALGLVDRDEWYAQVVSTLKAMDSNPISDEIDTFSQQLFSAEARDRKHAISRMVGYFIGHTVVQEQHCFSHPLLRLQARMTPVAYTILLLIKEFVMQRVIFRPELQQLQYKGQRVIIRLFEIFAANPQRLLPANVYQQYTLTQERAIADYLSGMTDVSAGKLYHKLLSPTSGSIFDRP